jgi:hypothetical protein
MLTLLGIYIVSTVLVDIFSCNPIDKTWNTNPDARGHCINFKALYQVTAGANVAIDLIILLMPQLPIWRLQMRFVERLGLAAIYGIGVMYASPNSRSTDTDTKIAPVSQVSCVL